MTKEVQLYDVAALTMDGRAMGHLFTPLTRRSNGQRTYGITLRLSLAPISQKLSGIYFSLPQHDKCISDWIVLKLPQDLQGLNKLYIFCTPIF